MRQRLSLTLLVCSLIAGFFVMDRHGATGAAEQRTPAKKPALQKFMQAKLSLSQGLLEGLVVEDFAQLDKNAKALLVLSLAEQWRVSEDPLYKLHSGEFQEAVKKVSKAAQDKSLDSASLGFMQVTMSCIECHRYVRNNLIADK